jgi:hypothetical protein
MSRHDLALDGMEAGILMFALTHLDERLEELKAAGWPITPGPGQSPDDLYITRCLFNDLATHANVAALIGRLERHSHEACVQEEREEDEWLDELYEWVDERLGGEKRLGEEES